jgi:hypothetical protein
VRYPRRLLHEAVRATSFLHPWQPQHVHSTSTARSQHVHSTSIARQSPSSWNHLIHPKYCYYYRELPKDRHELTPLTPKEPTPSNKRARCQQLDHLVPHNLGVSKAASLSIAHSRSLLVFLDNIQPLKVSSINLITVCQIRVFLSILESGVTPAMTHCQRPEVWCVRRPRAE